MDCAVLDQPPEPRQSSLPHHRNSADPASLAALLATAFVHRLWSIALGLFVVGWIFQFIRHAFEGKPPEFLSDWRFLLVGTRWWAAKVRGRV